MPHQNPESEPKSTSDYYIEIEDLWKKFGSLQVLKGVSLKVRRGETMGIIGRSGEGKSVMLKHIVGLLQADSGSIRVDGREVVGRSERRMLEIRKRLGMLFQEGALFDSVNVARNVAFPLWEAGHSNHNEVLKRVRQTLADVDLEEHLDKMPVSLSGGMRKRVSLARAIILRPECVLYDEPTSGLDPVVSDSINRLICKLQRLYNLTSIVVSHDMKSVYHVADRIAFYRQGEMYFLGSPEELRKSTDPVIQNFIQGKSEAKTEE